MYLDKHLKLHVTIIVSDNFFVNKICNESFLIFEIQKFYACAEPRVEIPTQDGCMGYLSLILYIREGTSLIALTHKGQAALWVTNGCTSMLKPVTT